MRTVFRPVIAAVAVILTVLVTGCAPATQHGSASPAPSAPSATLSVGPAADLNWTATTLAGQTFEGKSLLGRPALLWFWADWCPICQSQIPLMGTAADRYGAKVTMVGVGGMDKAAKIRTGPEVKIPGFTTLVDGKQAVWLKLAVTEQATVLVLDRNGRIVYRRGSNDRWDNPSLADVLTSLAG